MLWMFCVPHNDTFSCRIIHQFILVHNKSQILAPLLHILLRIHDQLPLAFRLTFPKCGVMMNQDMYCQIYKKKEGRITWCFVCVYVHVDVNIWGKMLVSSWYDSARWNIWKDFIGWLGCIIAERKYKCFEMLQSITGGIERINMEKWIQTMDHVSYLASLILYSPSFSSKAKKRGSNINPLSSRCRVSARCRSSTANFASVAISIFFCLIPCVTLDHNLYKGNIQDHPCTNKNCIYLLDSFNSCCDSGWMKGGRIFDDLTSNRLVFCDVCVFKSCQLFVIVACAWSGNKGW